MQTPSIRRLVGPGLLAWGLIASATGLRGVDLNLANQAELEMVKGIGPQLSERILDERSRGRFTGWPDFVDRMKGIGPSHAARLSAAGLRIEGLPYAGRGGGKGEEPPAK